MDDMNTSLSWDESAARYLQSLAPGAQAAGVTYTRLIDLCIRCEGRLPRVRELEEAVRSHNRQAGVAGNPLLPAGTAGTAGASLQNATDALARNHKNPLRLARLSPALTETLERLTLTMLDEVTSTLEPELSLALATARLEHAEHKELFEEQLRGAQEELNTANADVSALRTELTQAEIRERTSLDTIETLTTKLRVARSSIDRIEGHKSALEAQIREHQHAIGELQNQLAQTTGQLQQCEAARADTQRRSETFEISLNDAVLKIQRNTEERSALEKRFELAEAKAAHVQLELDKSAARCLALSSDAGAAKAKLQTRLGELEEQRSAASVLQQRYAALEFEAMVAARLLEKASHASRQSELAQGINAARDALGRGLTG